MIVCGQNQPKTICAAIKIGSLEKKTPFNSSLGHKICGAIRYYLEVCPSLISPPPLPSNHLKINTNRTKDFVTDFSTEQNIFPSFPCLAPSPSVPVKPCPLPPWSKISGEPHLEPIKYSSHQQCSIGTESSFPQIWFWGGHFLEPSFPQKVLGSLYFLAHLVSLVCFFGFGFMASFFHGISLLLGLRSQESERKFGEHPQPPEVRHAADRPPDAAQLWP